LIQQVEFTSRLKASCSIIIHKAAINWPCMISIGHSLYTNTILHYTNRSQISNGKWKLAYFYGFKHPSFTE